MFEQAALIDEMDTLRKFAQRLAKNAHNAKHLVQATMLRALEKKEQFHSGTNLFSRTSKIMFNIFVSAYRKKKRFETHYAPEPYINRLSVEPSQVAYADLVTVSEGMKCLSADHREILILVCVKGGSYEEVAKTLKLPLGTIRSRLSRARSHLQDILVPTLNPIHPMFFPTVQAGMSL